ncbi:MAG: tetratricopeptide repeat protein [Elusimicrobiota bacterium]
MKKLFDNLSRTCFGNKWFIIGIVIALYFIASFYKIYLTKKLPHYNPKDDTGFYWTESAFQYRYAKMITRGEKIPKIDYYAQWPEGVNVFKEFTVFEEIIIGHIYRVVTIFMNIPFHIFVIYFIAFFSSLSIIAIYLTAKEFGNIFSGLVAILFYSFSIAGFGRTIGLFEYESFALPFIFFHLFLFIKSIKTQKDNSYWFDFLSGLCLSIGLSSWHFTKFYFLTFVVIIYLWILIDKNKTVNLIERKFCVIFVFLVLSGLIVPVLRNKSFLISIPMIISYTVIIDYFLRKKFNMSDLKRKCIVILVLLVGIFILLFYFPVREAEYSHVYSLFVCKLVNFLSKPENPANIPFHARVLWVGAFNSPSIGWSLYWFLPIVIFSSISLVKIIGIQPKTEEIFLISLFVAFTGMFILISRLHVLFIFPITILAGKIVSYNTNFKFIVVLIVALLFDCYKMINYQNPTKLKNMFIKLFPEERQIHMLEQSQKMGLLEWLKKYTANNDVFLTSFETGPLILTYANRPVVFHPKFESSAIRNKWHQFLSAFYNEEFIFFQFCRTVNANYFIYQVNFVLDNSKDSHRYCADRLLLPKSSAAYKFHFDSHQLKNFKLVFQNGGFRVYKIVKEKPDKSLTSFISEFPAIYDISLYDNKPTDIFFNDSNNLRVFNNLKLELEILDKSGELIHNKDFQGALNLLENALLLNLNTEVVYTQMGAIYVLQNNDEKAIDFFQRAIKKEPNYRLAYKNLAAIYYKKKTYDKMIDICSRIIELDPLNDEAYNVMGKAFYLQKKYISAVKAFKKALECNPKNLDAQKSYYIISNLLKNISP